MKIREQAPRLVLRTACETLPRLEPNPGLLPWAKICRRSAAGFGALQRPELRFLAIALPGVFTHPGALIRAL